MARQPRRRSIEFARLLAADQGLAQADAMWRDQGYAVTSARLWFARSTGTYTARVVWRKRDAALSSVVYSIQGIALS
jgi:hypothetical protein